MALGDITILQQSSAQGGRGSRRINVAASANVINAGEPVVIVAGASFVIPNQASSIFTLATGASAFAVAGTGLLGIAQTTSNNTSTAAGYVDYVPVNSETVWVMNAKTSASVNTQAAYDALVGHRVTWDLTAGRYTMNVTDGATNSFIIQPLDITKAPGQIAFIIPNRFSASN